MNAGLAGTGPYTVVVTHEPGPEVDLTGFALTAAGTVTGDDGMCFYNQPQLPGLRWLPTEPGRHGLVVEPSGWAPGIVRTRIGLTVADGTFGAVRGLAAAVHDASGAEVARLDLSGLGPQNALIVGEVYLRDGAVKVRCVGEGFTDGLRGLALDAGVAVEEEEQPAAPENKARAISLVKPPAGAPPVDLRKHEVAVALVKNRLDGRTFRVVLAIDCSGSTKHLFRSGVMQRSLERMVPIAELLDDNGELEVWFFGDFPVRSQPVTVRTMHDYLERNAADKKRAEGGNYEPRVMKEIVDWTTAEPSPYPTLVLFWSDGGVHAEKKIAETLVKSSSLPVYWMFLGLGRSDYGVLARLDDVRGGVVDNAGFIPIDDIDAVADRDLYGWIFGNFVSRWVADATTAGILG
jgi:stress response protein SCP2